jgi:hypothetical protein
MANSTILAASRAKRKRETREGVLGPFIDGSLWTISARYYHRGVNASDHFQREKGEKNAGKMNPTGGVHLSMGEGETAGTSSGEAGMGRGRKLAWAGSVPLGLLFFCSLLFSFFYFLFSFLSFTKMLQFKSNHFQKNSENQCNDLTLQEN